jgi:hypothetical protein
MFLSAASQEEKALGDRNGFRVLTAEPEDVALRLQRHSSAIAAATNGEMKPRFPYVFNATVAGASLLPAMWVAPATLFCLHESASRVAIFLEKVRVRYVRGVRPQMLHTATARSDVLAALPAPCVGRCMALLYWPPHLLTISIFTQDYLVSPSLSIVDLVRQLLAGIAALASDVAVVRLRDLRDPDRAGLPNCWCVRIPAMKIIWCAAERANGD